jgi:hypothetical protein
MNLVTKQSQTIAVIYLPGLGRLLEVLSPSEQVVNQWLALLDNSRSCQLSFNLTSAQSPFRFWCHCVEFTPDHAGVQLTRVVEVSAQTLQSLARLLNQHFCGRGLQFEAVETDLWVNTQRPLPDDWRAVYDLLGSNVYFSLGNDASHTYWFSVINEVQMLIANQPACFTFNGVWFSHHPDQCLDAFKRTGSEVHYNPVLFSDEGIRYWIAQNQHPLTTWLKDMLNQVESLSRQHLPLVLTDGRAFWQLPDGRWQRLKQFVRRWLPT